MNMKTCMLPVEIQEDYTDYLYQALPLCALKAYPQYTAWTLENFINIYISYVGTLHYEKQGLEFLGYRYDIFDCIQENSLPEMSRILAYVKGLLLRGYYVYIILDEFYLSQKGSFQTVHFFHDSLIYGFDEEKSLFYAITYGGKSELLQKVSYSFADFKAAYESVRNEGKVRNRFVPFKIRSNANRHFSYQNYINGLDSYFNSRSQNRFSTDIELGTILPPFGFNSYRLLENYWNLQSELDFNAFKCSHFLLQHKQALFKGFEYLVYLQILPEEFVSIYSPYQQIIGLAQQFKMLFLKYSMLSAELKPRLKARIPAALRNLAQEEKRVLTPILLYLHQNGPALQSGSGRDSIYPDSMFRNLAITSPAAQRESVPSESFRYGKTFTFSWKHPVYIRWIHIKNPGYCCIYVDNCLQDEKILMANQRHRTETFPIDGKCYSIELTVYANHVFTFEDLGIILVEGNLLLDATLEASSCLMDKGQEDTYYEPHQAVVHDPYFYWNADIHSQTPEFLKASLPNPMPLNCIILQERQDVQNITEFTLCVTEASGVSVPIAHHRGYLPNEPLVFQFDTIMASCITLTILQTAQDKPYREPGICRFEAYHIEPDVSQASLRMDIRR